MRDEQNRQGSTEVIIDGKVIPLSGGDSAYLRQVAAYIDNKIAELRQNRAYARQNSERRAQILWLNLADDCLQARAESAELKEEAAAHAAEVYSLKRELVEQRLRMEGLKKRRPLPKGSGKTRSWKRRYQIWKRRRRASKQSMRGWKRKKNAWKNASVNWRRHWQPKSSAVKILRASWMTCSRSKTDSREE